QAVAHGDATSPRTPTPFGLWANPRTPTVKPLAAVALPKRPSPWVLLLKKAPPVALPVLAIFSPRTATPAGLKLLPHTPLLKPLVRILREWLRKVVHFGSCWKEVSCTSKVFRRTGTFCRETLGGF